MIQLAALKALNWRLIGLASLAMALVLLFAALRMEQAQNVKLKAQVEKCADARKADRLSYERAQADAKAKNLAEVKAIESRQEQISAEQKSKYDRDLARLRAGGVRQDLAAPRSPAGVSSASQDASPACRDDDQNVCVSRANIMRAAEIELGRNALIDWIERQTR